MKVPASICSVLLALAVIVQGLAPASAAAEAANPGGGCELQPGGFYYDFTTDSFCEPGGGSAGGRGPSAAGSAGGGGSGEGSPEEKIFIYDPVAGGVCGAFADAFIDRPQGCPNREMKVSCSPVDGCFKCPEEGCVAGRPPSRGQGGKGPARKPSKASRHGACRQLAVDERRVFRRYGDIHRFQLSINFTWEEILAGMALSRIGSGNTEGTVTFMSETRAFTVSAEVLPEGYWARWREYVSRDTEIAQLMRQNGCGEFHDRVWIEQSDAYYSLTHSA
jgi:hypothetical protein